jgi:serine/threonine protein kinase
MAVSSIPTHLGHYSIVEQIGTGGSSNVYLAMEDGKFNSVAIKQLRKTCLSKPFRQLIANEASVMAHFQHKNIVRLLGENQTEPSGPYLVLEYIRGTSLDHFQHEDTLLPIDQVLSIIEQVAQALDYIAKNGIVHRDIKPENLILTPHGSVKLMDFGCAVLTGSRGEMVAGSLAYMSPEQLNGETLDERSDIYSLGAVLYRLLTGRNTFDADNEFDARIAVLNFPALPIQQFRQTLPPKLITFIHHALEKECAQRYQNWAAFREDLANIAYQIKQSDQDLDIYRGFSSATQSTISHRLSASSQFTRSGFSRSMVGGG